MLSQSRGAFSTFIFASGLVLVAAGCNPPPTSPDDITPVLAALYTEWPAAVLAHLAAGARLGSDPAEASVKNGSAAIAAALTPAGCVTIDGPAGDENYAFSSVTAVDCSGPVGFGKFSVAFTFDVRNWWMTRILFLGWFDASMYPGLGGSVTPGNDADPYINVAGIRNGGLPIATIHGVMHQDGDCWRLNGGVDIESRPTDKSALAVLSASVDWRRCPRRCPVGRLTLYRNDGVEYIVESTGRWAAEKDYGQDPFSYGVVDIPCDK